jgi:aspartate-semialdehyde dehydrogenase
LARNSCACSPIIPGSSIGEHPMPAGIAGQTVLACSPEVVDAELVFSALDSSVAGEVEAAFAEAGRFVLSNARNYRMEPDVPLVIAEVNPEHLRLLDVQRRKRGWRGGIVTNGNCSTIVAALALAPLQQRFGIERVFMATMQAISGAGYPGVPSLDIVGNVIPLIKDEEPKIESELRKFLGTLQGSEVREAPIVVSAHANRVAVEHGHTICLSVGLRERAGADAVRQVIADWRGAEAARGLPTSPERALVVTDAPDRPQPRRDVKLGRGMTVSVGRIRPDPLFDVKFVAMGDNIVRGAAGASVLNAELLVNCGLLPDA